MTTLASPSSSQLEADRPYVLGRTAREHERLRRQALELEPLTAHLLDRLGLATGMRCLDVGCGPGEVMRLMAERVGPDDAATGLDVDGPLGMQALSALHAQGHTQCGFVEGDS